MATTRAIIPTIQKLIGFVEFVESIEFFEFVESIESVASADLFLRVEKERIRKKVRIP